MIRVTDLNGRQHLLHKDSIHQVSQPGDAAAWHGVRAFVRLLNGNVIEAREGPDQIAAQMVVVSPADYDALRKRLNNLETVQQASLERRGRIKAAAGALGWTAEREDGPLEFLIQQAQRSRELEMQRDAATQANTRFAAEHCALVGERDDLRAGVERLREALRRIHVRAEANVEHGRGMPDGSTFVVEDIARTALEGSAWAVDTSGATLGA